jgi:uncharacterized GH25 family protein/predicted RNA-binding protein
MCEANVYFSRSGQEELLMEGVDRIVPGDDNNIFLESIFGERRVVKARIKEMELVRHRIVLEEIQDAEVKPHQELWLEPDTNHGHFHPGEEARMKLFKGFNMRPDEAASMEEVEGFVMVNGRLQEASLHKHHDVMEMNLGPELDGLAQIYVHQKGDTELYATAVMEVGHHHHHGLQPLGLPLEIVPLDYSHARLGENYGIQVLKDGRSLAGAEVKATFAATQSRDYPHRLKTDEEGKCRLFLTARGNYLFSVTDGNITTTYTLIKSF